MASGFDVYKKYCALKAHFNSQYDFFKYDGKITANIATYERRNDKVFFERLSKKNMAYIVPFLVSNFVSDSNIWVGDLVINKEAEDTYFRWKRKMSRLFEITNKELTEVLDFSKARNITFNQLFFVEENEQPIVFRLMTQRYISIETYIIIDLALEFSQYFDRRLRDDIIYTRWSNKIRAYKPFLDLSSEKCMRAVKDVFLME